MRKRVIVAGAVLGVAVAATAGGIAVAGNGDDGPASHQYTEQQADQAKQAALDATGGGTVNSVESDSRERRHLRGRGHQAGRHHGRRPPRRRLQRRRHRGRQRGLRHRRLTSASDTAPPDPVGRSVRASTLITRHGDSDCLGPPPDRSQPERPLRATLGPHESREEPLRAVVDQLRNIALTCGNIDIRRLPRTVSSGSGGGSVGSNLPGAPSSDRVSPAETRVDL